MQNGRREWSPRTGLEVAVIGMAGRFPGADDLEAYWRNLCDGVHSVTRFTDEQLLAAGIRPELFQQPAYVRARSILREPEFFDAALFGYSPREAEMMDPQHRLFLETAWEALESAGYDPERHPGAIGIFAGAGASSYLIRRIAADPDFVNGEESLAALFSNDKDYLATRAAYKLDLRGPAVTVQCACSTALVSIHLACRSLLAGDADMSLAGAVYVRLPQETGYPHQQGSIYAPDGVCRPFDARAQGTVPGNGVGVVVLKRLEDALADGDDIHAVIKGSAINNDGSSKVGYTAPSVEGEAAVITAAQQVAEVPASTISYVEAHGSGTALGDPIEIAALTKVFGTDGAARQSCGVGSVKSNIGHLDVAAGMAGFIKTTLALRNQTLPPSVHFTQPNPRIAFGETPFYVNATLREWSDPVRSLRAGVSSFGIGGTNAHVVLEEAPPREESGASRERQLLLLSARTTSALDRAAARLAEHLERHPELPLPDVAYTLQVGRRQLPCRRVVVARTSAEAVSALQGRDPRASFSSRGAAGSRSVAFLFPGQGSQHVGMGRELYEREPIFRDTFDRCAEILKKEGGLDLREAIFPGTPEAAESAARRLEQTSLTQPALFVVEYALAQLLMHWGLKPAAMIGHSIGEYVAACLSSVFGLEDALRLVATRGRLTQAAPPGAMLAVALPAEQAEQLARGRIDLAAVNGPRAAVLSGPEEAIAALEEELRSREVDCRRLHTSHAFHSALLDPVVEEFGKALSGVRFNRPKIPYLSNLTGTWIREDEPCDRGYWMRHLRGTVRFAEDVASLLEKNQPVLLEVGPGNTLSTLARQCVGDKGAVTILPSMRRPKDAGSDEEHLLGAVGRAWVSGAAVDWKAFSAGEKRRRVGLPSYPFERKRFWWSSGSQAGTATSADAEAEPKARVEKTSFYARPGLQTEYLAPRNELEWSVAALWQELFSVEKIGVEDNFFDLGGDSMLAIQLVARLQQHFEVSLSVSEVLQSPTIAEQAASVREARAAGPELRRRSPVVRIQPKGHLPPVFCIHPAGGIVHCYIELARCLGKEQPFYALQHPGMDGNLDELQTFEEMATAYLEAMRAIQPKGPYYLTGWSFGGTVAFEMARQLELRGEEVAFLGLMDTPAPAGLYPNERPEFDTAGIFTFLAKGIGEIFGNDIKLDPTEFQGLDEAAQFEHFLAKSGQVEGMDVLKGGREQLARIVSMFHISDRAERSYRPGVCHGRITMFRVQGMDDYEFTGYRNHPDLADPAFGWNALSKQRVEVHPVPGTHMSMVVRPNVEVLAEKLLRCLEEARKAQEVKNVHPHPATKPARAPEASA